MRKTIGDLVGQKFGRLTVLQKSEESINPKKWICKCDCGNVVTIRQSNLISGNTKSCGCYNKEQTKSRKENLIGMKFGRLTVLSRENSDGRSKFLCKCECGNNCVVTISCLKNGHTRSCGCLQKERAIESNLNDLTGRKFERLLAVKRITDIKLRRNPRHTYYECVCDCGNVKIVEAYSLLTGDTKSCGCLKSEGEEIISKILKNKSINFKQQVMFDDLISPNGGNLLFDFGIYNQNNDLLCLIEYQGIQHYVPTEFGRFQREVTDSIKKEYCIKNKIQLFEIKYSENIEESLNKILCATQANTVPSSNLEKV